MPTKTYYEENKEKILKQQKEYRERNKEYYKEYHKKYNKENNYRYQKEYAKSWFAKCRYCKQNNKIVNSAARIMAYKATYTECQHCGSSKNLHVDHDHDTGKLRGILCSKCNRNDVFAGRGEVF